MAAYSTSEVIIAGNGVVIAMPDPRVATTTAYSKPTWVQTLKGCGHHPVAVAEAGEIVLAGTHGHLWALDRATGEAVWKSSRSDNGFSRSAVAVAVCGDKVIGANSNYVVARDLATGDLIWRTKAHINGNPATASLLVTKDGKTVVHASFGRITALQLRDGYRFWTKSLDSGLNSAMITLCECPANSYNPASFLVGYRGHIYQLDRRAGRVTRTTSLSGTGWKAVTIMMHPTNSLLFVAATSGQVTLHRASNHAVVAKNNLKGCYYGRSLGLAWYGGPVDASAASSTDDDDSDDEIFHEPVGPVEVAPPPPYDVAEEEKAKAPSVGDVLGHLYRDAMSSDDDDDDDNVLSLVGNLDGLGNADDEFGSTDKAGQTTVIVTIGRYMVGLRPDNLETKYKADLGVYQRLAPSVLVDPATGLAHVASTGRFQAFEATSGGLVRSIDVSDGEGGRTAHNITMAVGGVSTDTNLVPRVGAI